MNTGTYLRILRDPWALPSELDADTLATEVRKLMPEASFADLVIGQSFLSAPPLARYALAAAFCDMASHFYRYETCLCGIPSVDVQGTREEWVQLRGAIEMLATYKPRGTGGKETYDSQRAGWLKRCTAIVSDIIHWQFDSKDVAGRDAFFADMFHYGKNEECDSGHDLTVVQGWARGLYQDPRDDITSFPAHVSYIPFYNQDTGRHFLQAVALGYSYLREDDVLDPQYGIITFEEHGNPPRVDEPVLPTEHEHGVAADSGTTSCTVTAAAGDEPFPPAARLVKRARTSDDGVVPTPVLRPELSLICARLRILLQHLKEHAAVLLHHVWIPDLGTQGIHDAPDLATVFDSLHVAVTVGGMYKKSSYTCIIGVSAQDVSTFESCVKSLACYGIPFSVFGRLEYVVSDFWVHHMPDLHVGRHVLFSSCSDGAGKEQQYAWFAGGWEGDGTRYMT